MNLKIGIRADIGDAAAISRDLEDVEPVVDTEEFDETEMREVRRERFGGESSMDLIAFSMSLEPVFILELASNI